MELTPDERLRLAEEFETSQAGYHETIAWIRMAENKALSRIHDDLNEILFDRFDVGLHEYDRDYLFHTTLFMDKDAEKVRRGYEAICNEPIPGILDAKQFLIGSSETGELGTYRIVSETRKIVF